MIHFLAPVDFSEASLNALDHAVHMCSTCKGTLTLIYVFDQEEFIQVTSLASEGQASLRGEAEIRLKSLVKEIKATEAGSGLHEVHYILRIGDLVESIVDYAHDHSTDMIVMGTTGVGTVREAFIGSNTVKVFEQADCPVLCVPQDVPYQPVSKIIYATDYERNDQVTVKKIVGMANEFQAQVEVLHIDSQRNTDRDERYQAYVEKLSSYIPDERISYQRHYCGDDVTQCLDQYMNKESAQILALLTHNRSFLQKLLHRSVTKNLAYFAHSPLLIYKN